MVNMLLGRCLTLTILAITPLMGRAQTDTFPVGQDQNDLRLASEIVPASPAGRRAEAKQVQEDWNLKGQVTYIYQEKPPFHADYTLPGFNSLSPEREHSHSLSATAYLGVRPWSSAEVFFNEEMVLGVPFSNLTGLAGVPNSELQKVSGPSPKFYRSRAFLRQTWNLGGGTEFVESGIDQLAGFIDHQRVVLTAGNFSIVDLFDNNTFAHDGRKDFFNWVNVAYGAYDYAADVRGYTWGAALEYYRDNWTFRAGRFAVPKESNGLDLNFNFNQFHGDQVEIERAHEIGGQPGKVRLLGFRNVEFMGKFQDALDYAAMHGGAPDVANVRRSNVKYGYGINLEQSLTNDLGVFTRASWNDGETEMFSYTEVERSLQAGASMKGMRWGRQQDTVGVALVQDGLSKVHQEYLAAGGTGFLIGDGKLNYRPEQVFEGYYSIGLAKSSWLTLDYQHFNNPAYNADRGPVTVWGMRLHSEF